GGPKPSKYNPNPATCAAGSEALRSKVSLRVSPAAPKAQGKRVLAEKAGSASLFRQAGAAASRFRYHVPPVCFAHRNMMFPSLQGCPSALQRKAVDLSTVRSLAQQGFPARFPGRAPRRRGNVSWRKRPAAPAFFDKRTGACAPAFVIPEEGGTRPPVRFLPARPGPPPEGRHVRPQAPPPTTP